jgi:predicted Zn finger-like uncharacterized protein
MVVICPKCKAKLKVDDEKIKIEGIKVRCPKCQAVLLVRRPSPKPMPPAEERPVPREMDRGKILVAHDGEVVRLTIESILREEGYQVVTATDGVEAMIKVEREKPFLALLDVALPKIYGFEVCKQIKNRPETKETLVILLASVYDATRYKRSPESLYGADDYIEKHHIEDSLILKIRRLIEKPIQKPVPEQVRELEERPVPIERVVTRGELKEEEISQEPIPSGIDQDAIEKAKRFARIIISDIALYNQNLVEEGIKNNNFYALLEAEIQEGRALYNSRVLPEIRSQIDYYKQAIDDFIDKKRKTIGIE